jgi:hypothetical protein
MKTLKGGTGEEKKGRGPWRKGTAPRQGRKENKPYLSITAE